MFRRIAIIGLGLIGGSLGLAIKEKRLAKEVVGVSRRPSTMRHAIDIGAVDIVTRDLKKAVRGSDIVVICTPVLMVIEIAGRIKDYLEKTTILTDTGSTKSEIVKRIESMFSSKKVPFVGAHPIAGSEKSGIQYADKGLFKGSYCILTKTSRTDPSLVKIIKGLWRDVGMKVVVMGPEEHDNLLSRLSHLPHASSVALVNAISKKQINFTGRGLKDTTRIASSSPEMWADIFITNRDNISKDIKRFKQELSKIELALEKCDRSTLLALLKNAKTIRDSFETK